MKRFCLMLAIGVILLLTPYFSSSQSYIHFPEPGMVQGNWYGDNFYQSPPDGNVSLIYEGDTLAYGRSYAKICRHDSWGYAWCSNGIHLFSFYDSGKIYINGALSLSSPGVLYYDFTLNVGDTFDVKNYYSPNLSVVSQKTILTTLDGIQRRKITLVSLYDSTRIYRWLEGVGDMTGGVLSEIDFEGGHTTLICQKDSNGTVYENPSAPLPCATVTSVTATSVDELSSRNIIQVVANPFSDKLVVFTNFVHGNLKMFDAIGKIMYETDISEPYVEIPCTQFRAGIYFISIYSDKKQYYTKKVVKI